MRGLAHRFERLLPSGSFGRSVILLAGGTAVGQGIVFLSSPILTRLYSPDDFGAQGVFVAILSVLLVFASLRYEVAIPLPDDDESALDLLHLSVILVVVFSALVGVGAWLWGEWLLPFVNATQLSPYLWLVPLGLLGGGLYQALNYWAVRTKSFGSVARTKLSQSIVQVSTQITIGVIQGGPLGLLFGDVIGRTSGSRLLSALVKRPSRDELKGLFPRVSKVAARYRRFPMVALWSAVLQNASVQLPVVLMASVFGSSVVGWFTLSLRILQAPMGFIGRSYSQVFFAKAADALREGKLPAATLTVYHQLVVLGFGPIFIVGVVGSDLFEVVFGRAWREAGLYSQWLAPWLFFVFVSGPLSPLVFIVEKQREEFLFQSVMFVGRLASLLAGAYLDSASLAVQLFSLVSGTLWLCYMFWLLHISGNRLGDVARILLREGWFCLALGSPILCAKLFGLDARYLVGCGVLSGLLLGLRVGRHFTRRRAEA